MSEEKVTRLTYSGLKCPANETNSIVNNCAVVLTTYAACSINVVTSDRELMNRSSRVRTPSPYWLNKATTSFRVQRQRLLICCQCA